MLHRTLATHDLTLCDLDEGILAHPARFWTLAIAHQRNDRMRGTARRDALRMRQASQMLLIQNAALSKLLARTRMLLTLTL